MKPILFYIILLLSVQSVTAQVKDAPPSSPTRYIPYPHLREADIMWKTRHWERIDLREKINHPLYYPMVDIPFRKSLFNVLLKGINDNIITQVFADDKFEIPYTAEQIAKYASRIDTTFDQDDPDIIILIDTIKIRPKDVIAYELKSDWYFNKQRGEMTNRIIGISPIIKDPQTQEVYNLFWIWFPDARWAMTRYYTFNHHNFVKRLSYDDVFTLRYFNSYIVKQSNVHERAIKDYMRNNPMNQLLEGQEIKLELRNFEHDLWEY